MKLAKIFLVSVLFATFSLGALTFFLTPQASAVSKNETVLSNNTAPQFTLTSVEGKKISLSDFRGKAVILNFWGTWCPPCRAEIPDMVELQKQYGGDKFTFVGVALERPSTDPVKKVKDFMTTSGINYPILMGDATVFDSYQPLLNEDERGAVPATFIINKKGEIIASFVGSRDKATFEQFIKKAL
ncbi:MAG: TlpA disulfide reductase family protein [Chloroherpetonaceae bacterium]|nr:TlpA disulfide reductase family protein [Chloroherpetonaceae bacterium]